MTRRSTPSASTLRLAAPIVLMVSWASLASAQTVPAQPEPIPSPNDHQAMEQQGQSRMQFRGFADVDFRATDEALDRSTFSIGQLDMFVTSGLADDLSFLSEIVFEADDENRYFVDVERLLVQFSPSDYFDLGVGRYHTAIGFYNSAYHHGTWFQTAVGRPRIFEFEDDGGLLPIHGVGVTMRGRIPSGRLGLGWLAELSNGRGFSGGEAVQVVRDDSDAKAVNVGVIARPAWLPGLQTGVSFYRDKATTPTDARVDQSIIAAHAVYQGGTFEALNEVLFLRHTPAAGGETSITNAFYTQVSRKFDRLRPYLRYEYLDVPSDDPLFGGMGRTTGPSIGLKYDFRDLASLKIQWDRFTTRPASAVNAITAQLAFTF